MKDERQAPPTRHAPEHAPTVIHHPEEDETLLARWLRRGMEQGSKFWLGLVGVGALVVAALIFASRLTAGDPTTAQAWTDLAMATAGGDPEAQLKVAETYPDTPAAAWAQLQAAGARFGEGVDKLTTDREGATALLNKAFDLYEEVSKTKVAQGQGGLLGRMAAFGMARTLEARNELDRAIEQYEKVAATWPNTEEAKESARLAKLLRQPESRDFYKQLYAYKPPKPSSPGSSKFPGSLDSLLKGITPKDDALPSVFPPDSPSGAGVQPKEVPTSAPAPKATETPSAPKAEAKPDASKKAGDLPGDVFTPKAK